MIIHFSKYPYYLRLNQLKPPDEEACCWCKNGYTYYDQALTPIEKSKLLRSIDEIKRPFASKEPSDDGEQVSDVLSECKDKRLISILQENS